jgi:hypothetical protein
MPGLKYNHTTPAVVAFAQRQVNKTAAQRDCCDHDLNSSCLCCLMHAACCLMTASGAVPKHRLTSCGINDKPLASGKSAINASAAA